MQFVNHTPFAGLCWLSMDANDTEYVTIVARVKYRFESSDEDGLWTLRFHQDQEELFCKDVFYDMKKFHVQYESDYVPYKTQGDLIVNLSEHIDHYASASIEVLRYTPLDAEKKIETKCLLKHKGFKNLGFVHRSDPSRMRYIGNPDQKWIETRAPYLPVDFSDRHYSAAHEKLQLPNTYFRPGDSIVLQKLLPGQHKQTVIMPGVYLKAINQEGISRFGVMLEADTVLFDVEDLDMSKNALYVSYRARVHVEKLPEKVILEMMLEDDLIEKRSA